MNIVTEINVTDVAESTLNYWKEYFDWHNFESEQFILEIMNTDTIKLFAENGVLAAVRPYNDYFISQSFV